MKKPIEKPERPSKLTDEDMDRLLADGRRCAKDMDKILRKVFGPVKNVVLR